MILQPRRHPAFAHIRLKLPVSFSPCCINEEDRPNPTRRSSPLPYQQACYTTITTRGVIHLPTRVCGLTAARLCWTAWKTTLLILSASLAVAVDLNIFVKSLYRTAQTIKFQWNIFIQNIILEYCCFVPLKRFKMLMKLSRVPHWNCDEVTLYVVEESSASCGKLIV